MRRYLIVLFSAVLLVSCNQDELPANAAKEVSDSSIMQQISVKVRELASSSGFSDDDATESAIFVYEQLTGSKPDKDRVQTRIAESLATAVSVHVWYGSGPHVTYEIQFSRSGRTAYFESLRYHPSQ